MIAAAATTHAPGSIPSRLIPISTFNSVAGTFARGELTRSKIATERAWVRVPHAPNQVDHLCGLVAVRLFSGRHRNWIELGADCDHGHGGEFCDPLRHPSRPPIAGRRRTDHRTRPRDDGAGRGSRSGTKPTVKRFAVGWRYFHLDLVAGRITASAKGWPCTQGAAMTKILNDFLIFACATALVTWIVLAAATLLI